ncbi:MAG: hypothetical protein ACK5OX_02415 [Desertimonas sp.]
MRRALGAALLAVAAGACTSGADGDDTLPPVGTLEMTSIGGSAPTSAGSASPPSPSVSSVPAGPVGSGVVRIAVRLEGQGIVEELMLDRSTVAVADLDSIALDATCTAIDGGDGGDGLTVSVVDLRRLRAGQRLVSAMLTVPGDAGPGEHTGRLDVGDAAQQTARYEGAVVIDEGAASGSFDLRDGRGAAATGSFACATDVGSLPTTTTVPAPTLPPDGTAEPAPEAPTIVIETAPPVPRATS